MGMQVGGSNGGIQSDINVTPLVDVVLVLLIIFIVMVPAMMHGYDVDVPGEASVWRLTSSRTARTSSAVAPRTRCVFPRW